MYLLKQYIKSKFKKFIQDDNRLYLKECNILDNALNISNNINELKKNLKKIDHICDEKINKYIYDRINYKKESILKLLKKYKIKNSKKIVFYYKFFIFKGWLVDSYYLREIYLDVNKNKKNYQLRIIEKNDKKNYHNLLNYLKNKITVNQNLKKMITDKNIAIVGPALSKQINGREIDKFDIIVRINQIDKSNLNLKFKGTKTDIVYLNGTKTEEIIKKKKFEFIKKTKAIILKTDGYMKFFSKKGFFNIYKMINIDNYMTFGISNMLPYILFQILLCNPAKVKIFDNDFLVNPIRVKNYYNYKFNLRTKFLNIIFLHDPLSQFNFVKFLYNSSKIIVGDKKFTKIIKLSKKNFLKELENSYDLH